MRHRNKKYIMQGKDAEHTTAIIKSQVLDLIIHEKIKTTESKGKILKSRFDRLVTEAKKETPASRARVASFLGNNEEVVELFYKMVDKKLKDRSSGYTRVLHTLPRKGDGARQVFVMVMNTEVKEKESRAKKLLAKRKEDADKKSVGGKIKKAASKVAKTKE
jgi:large subunit ribosomal protein L17